MYSESKNRRFKAFCNWAKIMLAVILRTLRCFCFGNKDKQSTKSPVAARRQQDQIKLTYYEQIVQSDMIDPFCIHPDWGNIAGQKDAYLKIKKALQLDEKQRNPNFKPKHSKTGVLLYGPDRCGKSTMVHATAKYAQSNLIRVTCFLFAGRTSSEQKEIADAVVSLATKLRPSLVFVELSENLFNCDKLDEAATQLKAYVLEMIDSLLNSKYTDICVMGTAPNRYIIDEVLLKRFQVIIYIPLPSLGQRETILAKILDDEPTSSDINLKELSAMTQGLSVGDLQQLCRTAALFRIKESFQEDFWTKSETKSLDENEDVSKPWKIRPINMQDLRKALLEMRTTIPTEVSRPSTSYNTFRAS